MDGAGQRQRRCGGKIKAKEVCDACYGRYRSLHDWLEDTTGKVRAIDLESPSPGYSRRPARGRACEYIADFERIGRDALRRPQWKGRLKLFEIYYLHAMEYENAIKLVAVADGIFDYWMAEVKRAVGREFSRCGLFPPIAIFSCLACGATDRSRIGRLFQKRSHAESPMISCRDRRGVAG